jgi:hypothetical protein
LANDISMLTQGGGTGRIDEALAWSWRMVSPKWEGQYGEPNWPAPSGQTRKLAILFTDAHTTANELEMGRTSSNLGQNNGSTEMFDVITNLCGRMKQSGVDVMIFHVLGNRMAEPYMKTCATDGLYFGIENRADFLTAIEIAGRRKDNPPRLTY